MRVTWTRVIAAWLGIALASPGAASAQGGELSPVVPSTAVSAQVDGAHERDGDFRGGELGLGAFGTVAPVPWLELGAAGGARASWIHLEGGASRGRIGLVPLAVWVGAGRAWGDISLAARLRGGIGPGVIGAEQAGSNGERAFTEIEGALGWERDGFSARLTSYAGYALSGASGHAGLGGARLSLAYSGPSWPLGPFVSGRVVYASDLGWGGTGELGVLAPLGRHSLRLAITGPLGPVGQWFALSVGWRMSLEPDASGGQPAIER